MYRLVSLCLLGFALVAADIPLPQPTLVTLHPDGARIAWELKLSAGTHRLVLPERSPAEIEVRSGARTWRSVSLATGLPQAAPAALTALVVRRNTLAARYVWLEDQERIAQQFTQAWEKGVAGKAPEPAWQEALEAHLQRLSAMDATRLSVEQEQRALSVAVAEITQEAVDSQAILGLDALSLRNTPIWLPAQVEEQWSGRQIYKQRALELTLETDGMVVLIADSKASHWQPSASFLRSAQGLTLIRHVQLMKPGEQDWGVPRIHISSAPLYRELQGPPERAVMVRSEPSETKRQAVASGSSVALGRGPAVGGEVLNEVPVEEAEDRGFGNQRSVPFPAQADAHDPFLVKLPAQELGIGVQYKHCSLPSVNLPVLVDEWVLLPQISPIAQRRLTTRLDALPLLAGRVVLLDENGHTRGGRLPDLSPGAEVSLVLDEDSSIFVSESTAWPQDPEQPSAKRQRGGQSYTVWNMGTQIRKLRAYLTMPLSQSENIRIALDPESSPGSQELQPGLRSWMLALNPGSSTTLSLGYQITASGGARL